MKFNLSWGLLLLLAGCQITQPLKSIDQDDAPQTNTIEPSTSTQSQNTVSASPTENIQQEPLVVTPQEQDDLWQRITMQFELDIPEDPKVDYFRKWFIEHPKHLETVAQRAEPFLYLITEKIEQRDFPLEIALLPIVESAFDVKAYSPGKAAGLWQFLSVTAKRYGLEQDFWYDGRRDVYASTEAALNYLSYLNERFNGNWYHSIAAYNSGGGRVSGAIKKNLKQNKPTDFFSLSLPKETSSYVPKLLALADVIANRDKYGVTIPAIANKPYLELIKPGEQLDLRIAADYAGLSYQTLLSYNPGYNQWATAPTGAQQLLVPVEKVTRFNQMLSENRGKGVHYLSYKVKRGDSISVIAHRYSIPGAALKTTNKLHSNTIRIGQYLLVPVKEAPEKINQQIAALTTSSSPAITTQVTHTVQSGENLWNIAKRYKVSRQTLAQWNDIQSDSMLKIGQQLIVKQIDNGFRTAGVINYKVKPGDTLSEIALRFKVSSDDIMKWNNLSQAGMIRAGQTLRIYPSNNQEENA